MILLPDSEGSNVLDLRGACSPIRAWQSISRLTPANQKSCRRNRSARRVGSSSRGPWSELLSRLCRRAETAAVIQIIVVLSGIFARTMREIVR